MRPIDASPADLETVRQILDMHVPEIEIRAFGSRVSWTARETSDLDLALMTDEPLDILRVALLREAFTNSDLPFRVDIVDWATTSDRFRKIIKRDHAVFRARSRSPDKASGWQHTTLGMIIDFLSGGTPPKSNTKYWDGTIPWVSAKDMKRLRLRDTRDHLTTEGAANGTRLVPAGTVLMLTRGMTLLSDLPICVIEQAMTFNQDVKALRPGNDVLSDFLPYLMLGNRTRLSSLVDLAGHGTGRLNSEELKAFEIQLPPLPEQRAIAHVLGTLDDKIELNRCMNETLEAMVRAIFRDWFVDFGPTRAKAEGRKPYLSPEIWELFPDALDDEGKPAGWEIRPASDLFRFNPRESIRKGTMTPYLDMAALPTVGPVPDAPIQREYKSGSKFKDGDTLFARITPCLENGKTAYVFDLGDEVVGTGSTEFIVIRSRAPRPKAASYLLARDPEFRACAERSMAGTSGRQRADSEALGRYEVAAPADDRLWTALGNLVDPMMDRIIVNAHESRSLTRTRDLLLPKLVSGEIRLHEAVEAVA